MPHYLHRAITTDDEIGLQHWASLDGEDWLPISRAAADTPEDAETFRQLLEGDGNFMPLRFGRRHLVHLGASFAPDAVPEREDEIVAAVAEDVARLFLPRRAV